MKRFQAFVSPTCSAVITCLLFAVVTAQRVSGATHDTTSDERVPNVIFVMADDLGWGDLGSYGQELVPTPHLDQMAAEGMRFTAHYSGSTVCAPSRCSLMTGLHTGHCEIRGNKEVRPLGQMPIADDAHTVAEVLKAAGYVTGMAGKWGLGALNSTGHPNRQGFDWFYGYLCQRSAHRYYPPFVWRNEDKIMLKANADGRRGAYVHDLIIDEALGFIREHKDDPFFLYMPLTIPHADIDVPEDSLTPFIGAFGDEKPNTGGYYKQARPKAAFAGMVSRMDRDMGRVLALLRELDLDNDTIVFFTSDNGPHAEGGAQPAFFKSSGPFRGIKRDLYEGGIRVPMIARWPGRIAPGSTSEHVSAFWDFLPTAAQLAGVEHNLDGIDGLSFVPALLRSGAQETHEFLYWEFHERGGKQAVRWGNWKGVRVGIKKDPAAPVELYDLASDPGETTDVAAAHPEVVAQIRTYMQQAHTESDTWKLNP